MERFLSCGYAVIDIIDNKEYFGGAAAGVAINGKRLGMEAGLCALFGFDSKSKEYWEMLIGEGVDMALSIKKPQVRLPVNNISHYDRTTGWNDYGISAYFSDISLDRTQIQKYGLVHLANAHPELIHKVIEHINSVCCRISYCPGPKTVLDPNYYLSLDILQASDFLFLNEEEWMITRQHFNLLSPEDLIALGPDIAAITLGPKGSDIIYRDGVDVVCRHIPVPEAQGETTGAGDAFALGFLIGNQYGLQPPQAAELGTSLAILALQRNGVVIDGSYLNKFKEGRLKYIFDN